MSHPETRRYYQQLTRFSSAFAFLADISMLVLGGELKRREKLSARLGDILSMLYLCSATLKRYESEGRQQADAPLMHWAMWDAMYKAQMAFDGVIANFPVRWIGRMLYRLVFPLGHPYDVPSDRIGHQVAKLLIEPSAARDRLTAEAYLPKVESEAVGALELALAATIEAEPIEAKIRAAEKSGVLATIPDANVRDLAHAAFAAGIVTPAEYAVLKRRNELRDIVIRVDDFPHDLGRMRGSSRCCTKPPRPPLS
jgi:acyl-CoA dehydrogenase